MIPGPYCTLILAELGAEVVKLEDTGGGDYFRMMPPLKEGLGGAFYALNRGKRSIGIDLKRPEGRELLLRLLPGYDVVVESFRPGVLERLDLHYERLREVHPEVILCSISGYGQDGPLRHRAGHDIDYLALGGVLGTTGDPDQPPAVPGVQIADIAGGAMWATIQILAALRSGQGAHLDVSMTEGAMALLAPWFGELAFGAEPLRRGESMLNGGRACYRSYQTSDGRHLAVGALEPKFWAALCGTVGEPCDMSDPVAPPARQAELKETIAGHLAAADRDTWCERFATTDACVEPVLEMEEVRDHPQHRHRGVFFDLDDPERGTLSLLRLPLSSAARATSPAPRRGEHTDEILAAAGLDQAEISALRGDRIIG